MTVCVAAICKSLGSDFPTILGASDRMLTAGDIEFEPERSKIYPLTNSIRVMLAGDSAMQWEVMLDINADVLARIKSDPKNWWNVRDVADLYARYYNRAKLKRAENEILAPLGLDQYSFMAQQHQLNSELIHKLATQLQNFNAPAVETIFAGIDMTGAHIYTAYNSYITCLDAIGFAAIGIGSRHTNSEFMFAKHTNQRALPETLRLLYWAKKRAEVAPGVGMGTDMFMIGPTLGSGIMIGDHVLRKLEEVYEDTQKKTRETLQESDQRLTQYIEQLTKPEPPQQQVAKPGTEGVVPSANDPNTPS